MKNGLIGFFAAGALIVLGFGTWWYWNDVETAVNDRNEPTSGHEEAASTEETASTENQGAAIGEENLVVFRCAGGSTITAVFERDIVGITLSDGRQLTLRQAVSGSGIRYLSNDQTIEFRGKGNEASLVESEVTTHASCVASN
jgi:predicted ribosomally synthesized peptide with SipW-like signal peptide